MSVASIGPLETAISLVGRVRIHPRLATELRGAKGVAVQPTVTDDEFRYFRRDACDAVVAYDETRRTKTMGGLDPETWQTFCGPNCGERLRTVFVGDE